MPETSIVVTARDKYASALRETNQISFPTLFGDEQLAKARRPLTIFFANSGKSS